MTTDTDAADTNGTAAAGTDSNSTAASTTAADGGSGNPAGPRRTAAAAGSTPPAGPHPRLTRRTAAGAAAGLAGFVLLILLPLLNLSLPGVLPGPTYTPGSLQLLAMCMLMAAAALTYHLLLGVAGLLSFGHALYFGAGVYGLAIILQNLDIPLLPAMGLTLLVVIVLAHVVGSISLRVSGIPFAMVTLAFAQAGSVIVGRNPDGTTGGDEGLTLRTDNLPDFLVGVVNTRNLYWLALAVLVVVFVVVTWVESSRAGHLAAAVRENELRVRVLGLQPYLVKLLIFVVSAVLVSIIGMVFLLLQSGAVPRAISADLTITLLVMVVLGGVGSRWGAVIGGIFYTILDQRLTTLANSDAIDALPDILRIPLSEPLFILGTLFILVVLFLPGGLTGAAKRLAQRRNRRGRSTGHDGTGNDSTGPDRTGPDRTGHESTATSREILEESA
ncbi:branched-chain amino acid transport system permease protein [Pseudarthrobacter oxydans]|uniref:branched-chain amino acid ABC transporter permease n=1 Tax=Pseudarthrobacter oxydans TaxID=1671 RepID=UPI00278457BC|nr:branched-chain amino acid ABC transporter permease [Pseudarthrobacter oxydans]MDP9981351.1 branched-chain amino acid transport system permease protein [Pseudarthrobacter oxydans]